MKAHLTKRLVCLILAIVLCLSAAVIPALAANDTKNVKVKVQKVSNDTVPTELNPERQAAAEDTVQTQSAEGPVRVSIVVKGGSVLDKYSTNGLTANYAAANYRQQVRASQNAVAREISADVLGGKKLDVVWNLTLAANIISANVESDQIDAIRALPDVEAVVVEQRYYPDRSAEKLATQPNMATSSSMIGTNVAYETGYTGAGTRIAVIDTGIDTDHQSFDNGAFDYALQQEANGNENYIKSLDLLDQSKVTAVLSQLNIAQNGVSADDLYYGSKLPFAYNYVDKNTDVTHDNDTQSEHGSHVAGIAAANKYVPQTDGDETTYVSALDTVKTQGRCAGGTAAGYEGVRLERRRVRFGLYGGHRGRNCSGCRQHQPLARLQLSRPVEVHGLYGRGYRSGSGLSGNSGQPCVQGRCGVHLCR